MLLGSPLTLRKLLNKIIKLLAYPREVLHSGRLEPYSQIILG